MSETAFPSSFAVRRGLLPPAPHRPCAAATGVAHVDPHSHGLRDSLLAAALELCDGHANSHCHPLGDAHCNDVVDGHAHAHSDGDCLFGSHAHTQCDDVRDAHSYAHCDCDCLFGSEPHFDLVSNSFLERDPVAHCIRFLDGHTHNHCVEDSDVERDSVTHCVWHDFGDALCDIHWLAHGDAHGDCDAALTRSAARIAMQT